MSDYGSAGPYADTSTTLASDVEGNLCQALVGYGFIEKVEDGNVLFHIYKAQNKTEQITANR
ncbi:MAG: hypothetical protein OEZ28_06830 [Nitrospinota bacterium]|nr:hypothetical protein [Nitrospinota bacterium]